MRPPEFNTEQKILDAAITIFVRYGFYGITLQQIAKKAGVNKSAIHYYFRSKEKLYKKVLMEIIQVIESDEWNLKTIQKEDMNVKWFLNTEMYNNSTFFEKSIKELYPDDWGQKLILITFISENGGAK
ncbi:MAG: TetR/AcrR family transcriptional regulator [Paludibacter sp.]|jgi:AcrR family transcriptional regulator|nr:TetR/AcrR family transcriptional regulator [Paludibacter sp.]MDD4199396.1 TetR/AcrR family transcriptional regulator [Paludibacter sp.]MDD4429016.1 TetR/AcrR family transcriptional regulator [Paludibacter sp.]PKP33743.1 MAG: TetR/AcrR family transcriptional regulator [Bacteroidetes bacterium HGW-Bacteroidetes-17]